MKSKLLNQAPKTFAVVFDSGDEVMAGLAAFAREQKLSASQFTAIGAFKDALLGFFSFEKKDYMKIPITEQVEVLALTGDIALEGDAPKIHAHVVLGKPDGTSHGGHLMHAHAHPTLEVILTESPKHLHRKHDPASGLALINLDAS